MPFIFIFFDNELYFDAEFEILGPKIHAFIKKI